MQCPLVAAVFTDVIFTLYPSALFRLPDDYVATLLRSKR